jgi:hypothetical protein
MIMCRKNEGKNYIWPQRCVCVRDILEIHGPIEFYFWKFLINLVVRESGIQLQAFYKIIGLIYM